MVTLTLDLLSELVEKAKEKGLLSSPAIESYIRQSLKKIVGSHV
jgi:hypothetical protein